MLPLRVSCHAALLLACASADSANAFVQPAPGLQRGVVAKPTRPTRLYAVAQTASPLQDSARSPAVTWGVCGFLTIIGSAIGRLTKVAVVPAVQRDITVLQWGLLGGTMAAFAYFEGYKAFQLKFSPMLVQRAMTLSRDGTPAHHIALAPFYSMGLFHSTKKCAPATHQMEHTPHAAPPASDAPPWRGAGARSSRGASPAASR
jgi:hypothetical protein